MVEELDTAMVVVPELGAAGVTRRAFDGKPVAAAHYGVVATLGALARDRDDGAAFTRSAEALQERVKGLASARGEYENIDLEVRLYRLDPFGRGLALYLLAFVLVAVGWLRPGWRWLPRIAIAVILAGLALHVSGIVLRSVIRGRPPISTLYATR